MKLYVLMEEKDGKLEFYRGDPEGKKWNSGKRRNIRVHHTIGLAEAAKKSNSAPHAKIVEFVPRDVNLREDPINWTWEELDNHLEAFDYIEVNYFDGGEHIAFSGDSGVSVLRVTDISPQKRADGKVILHISTDSNFFGKGRHRIMSDDYITRTIEEQGYLTKTQAESLKKAFKIGVPPVGPPTIG